MKRRARKSAIRAFTLIELMMVMGMMAILAAAVGMALAQAMEQGRVSRTQAQIARIHGLLMTRYDSYRTRNIRLFNSAGLQSAPPSWSVQDQQLFATQRRVDRLRAIRMTMRLEMPENLRDLYDIASGSPIPVYGPGNACVFPTFTTTSSTPAVSCYNSIRRPALSDSYFRRIQVAMTNFGGRFATTGDNAPSECLYLILASIQEGDTNGLDSMLPSEIGDTDQDGIPEILDSWGRPIFFIRWAPGAMSPMQNQEVPDPFDPLHMDPRSRYADASGNRRGDPPLPFNPAAPDCGTYALTPLVYSAGPDGSYGLAYSPDDIFTYSASQAPIAEANDPFCVPATLVQWGTPAASADGSEGWHDNITNHLLSQK